MDSFWIVQTVFDCQHRFWTVRTALDCSDSIWIFQTISGSSRQFLDCPDSFGESGDFDESCEFGDFFANLVNLVILVNLLNMVVLMNLVILVNLVNLVSLWHT